MANMDKKWVDFRKSGKKRPKGLVGDGDFGCTMTAKSGRRVVVARTHSREPGKINFDKTGKKYNALWCHHS